MSFGVVFMGTPAFAVPVFDALLQGPDRLLAVVTQPDRPRGRGQRSRPSAVKERAVAAGVPVLEPETVRDEGFRARLRDLSPDLVVVVAFGQILPGNVLDLPPKGCLNVHASLLPKYRGAAPIPWAIMNGERVTGITIIRMAERLDAGDILRAREVIIGEEEDGLELSERLSRVGAQLLAETVRGLERGVVAPVSQREEEATFAPRLTKKDGEIKWQREAVGIARQVRALIPWPSAHTVCKGKLLKIQRARPRGRGVWGQPGEVIRASHGTLWVAAGEGYLDVEEVQMESRPRMTSAAFHQGHGGLRGHLLGQS